jgi:hypothetical protein
MIESKVTNRRVWRLSKVSLIQMLLLYRHFESEYIYCTDRPTWFSNGCVIHTFRKIFYQSELNSTRWFKYDWDKLWLVYTQIVPVIFEPPCMWRDVNTLSINKLSPSTSSSCPAQQPNAGQSRIILEVSRSHTTIHHSR